MKVHSRIQLNLMGGETMFNSDVQLFDNLVLPVFWLEIVSEKIAMSFFDLNSIRFISRPSKTWQRSSTSSWILPSMFFQLCKLS